MLAYGSGNGSIGAGCENSLGTQVEFQLAKHCFNPSKILPVLPRGYELSLAHYAVTGRPTHPPPHAFRFMASESVNDSTTADLRKIYA